MRFDERPDFKLLGGRTRAALTRLAEQSADGPDDLDFSADLATGRLLFLRGRFGAAQASPDQIARKFLIANAALFGLKPDLAGLGKAVVTKQESGSRVRMSQLVDQIRVYGAGIRVEIDRAGAVTTVCGRFVDGANALRRPEISQVDAVIAARDALGVRNPVEFRPELVLSDVRIDTEDTERTRVGPAWLVSVEGPDAKVDVLVSGPGAPVVIVTPTGSPDVEEFSSDVPLVHLNDVTGVPSFVTFGPNGMRTSQSASGDPTRAALAFFLDHPLMFGTGDVPNQLHATVVQRDPGPPFETHVVLQQIYGKLEVLGAQLRVHLNQSLNVTSISGNYLRNPRVVPEPTILQFEARKTAVHKVRQTRTQQGVSGDPAQDVKDDGLVVFPGELTRAPYARNTVAWRFVFPEATLFIDARSDEVHGGLLFAFPHRLGADRNIFDARGQGEISIPQHVMTNSTPIAGTPQNAEVAPADAFLAAVLGFYTGLSRDGWDGKNSPADLVTNSAFTITTNAGAHWDIFRKQMWFETGQVTAWLVGHEFTHGVTAATAFLMPIDEPGAINEHYSDVMGGVVIGDLTVPEIRMTPGTYSGYVPRSPACAAPEAVFTPSCDSGNVHINCAIGNRAASLLGLGNAPAGSHVGIGMNRLGRLFYETVTTRMHSWSTYIDERLNTWEMARILAARGVLVPNDANPSATLDFMGVASEVSWAFKTVGVDPALIPGWYSVPGSPFGIHSVARIPYWEGQFSPTCKLIGDMEMVVQLRDPVAGNLPWWEGRSRVNGPGAGAVAFPGGVLGASIVSHPIGDPTRPQPKDTVITVFHSGFLPFEARPVIIPIDDPACPPPPTGPGIPPLPRPESEFVSSGVTHWDFGVGGKGTDQLNGSFMVLEPGGLACTIDLVEVELLDRNGQILGRTQPGQAAAVFHYGAFGAFSFGVQVVRAMVGGSDPGIDVHWWFDVGSAVRYRVHYYCTGDRCDLR